MEPLPKTLIPFLLHFMRRQKWSFIVLMGAIVAHVLESNVRPYALKLMIDTATKLGGVPGNPYLTMAEPLAIFLGAWVMMVTLWRIQEYVYIRTIPQFQADVRMGTFAYVQQHAHSFFADHFAGSIAAKIADLPRSCTNIIDFVRWRILTTSWVVGVGIVWLSIVSWRFSLLVGAWVVMHMGVSYFCARRVSAQSRLRAENLTTLQGHIVDVVTSVATMRLFSRRAHEYSYIGKWQAIEQASFRKALMDMMKARLLMDGPMALMYAVMLFMLVSGWRAGWVSAGDIVFVAFTTFEMMHLIWMVSNELPNLFNEIGVAQQALNLVMRPHDITDASGAKALEVKGGEIVFDNVHFHYIAGRDIFRDKNITIRAGEKVGLVGFSGSGKTTFVHLVLRFFDVEQGRILIDGQDIAQVTQDSLRAQIAMIPQDTTLFHRSLMDNIRYGRLEASDEEVIEASKRAHCHEFVEQINEGYGALVGERGIKLSGGQRQRIAIARAMLKNAPILILDEATSSLDSVTEKTIKNSLSELMKGRTTIVIAHRLSTLADMDRILVFEKGRIAEDGTHAQLLATGGHYAKLWNMQAGGFLPDAEE